ncbi:uncharacterized protein L201_003542 [Kwoniella dendrophila CBS 6074]|uniref:DUF6534 domain-containing protein n=1 Tax=Kwoniella dendrophila CBS 6074 TaxID=1295534 RepID=A0AAX4JV05_9TREE
MSTDVGATAMTPEQIEIMANAAFSSDLGMNLGPFLVGCLWDAILFGVVTQQYIDWCRYSSATEGRLIKYITHWVALASTLWTGTVIFYNMRSFVYYFGRFIVFTFVDIALLWPVLGVIMSIPIQFFYALRAYRLHQDNKCLLILFSLMILAEAGLTMAIAIVAAPLQTIFEAGEVNDIVRAWQVVTLCTDVLMTATLAWGLWRSRTGWSHTDALVKKLLLITIETQLAPTLVMTAFVISWSLKPTSTLGIFFDVAIPKAYEVGYLATLNSRYSLRQDADSHPGQKYSADTKPNTYALGGSRLQQATVHIDVETHTESFQMEPQRTGINRNQDLYELKEGDVDSVENLDYTQNLSKKKLNDPSSQV